MYDTWDNLIRENINDENKKEFYSRFYFVIFSLIVLNVFIYVYVVVIKDISFIVMPINAGYFAFLSVNEKMTSLLNKAIFYITFQKIDIKVKIKYFLIFELYIILLPLLFDIIFFSKHTVFFDFLFIIYIIIAFFMLLGGLSKIFDFLS